MSELRIPGEVVVNARVLLTYLRHAQGKVLVDTQETFGYLGDAIAEIQEACAKQGHEMEDAGDEEHQVPFCSVCGYPKKASDVVVEDNSDIPF